MGSLVRDGDGMGGLDHFGGMNCCFGGLIGPPVVPEC